MAFRIVQFAVAGEFGAAFFGRPAFALTQQFSGNPALAVAFEHEHALQIADRAAFRSLHIVVPELALRKPGGKMLIEIQKVRGVRI